MADAANWQAHGPGSLVANLADTRVDLYTSAGVPGGATSPFRTGG